MKRLEPLWNEVSPYAFSGIGIGAISAGNWAGIAFGVLLLVAALLLIEMRRPHRVAARAGRTAEVRRSTHPSMRESVSGERHQLISESPTDARPRA